MADIVGTRKLIALSLGPTEFLVKSSGSQSEVQTCLQGMLPNSKFTLSPLSDAASAQSRLKQNQVELLQRFQKEAATQLNTFQVKLSAPLPSASTTKDAKTPAQPKKGDVSELNERDLERVAGGAYSLFDPTISLVSRPLLTGPGPVGVTVGVGIAGKF